MANIRITKPDRPCPNVKMRGAAEIISGTSAIADSSKQVATA